MIRFGKVGIGRLGRAAPAKQLAPARLTGAGRSLRGAAGAGVRGVVKAGVPRIIARGIVGRGAFA